MPYDRSEWSGPGWTAEVNRRLRWRRPDCKWAFYADSPEPACDVSRTDPHRDHLVPVAEAHRSGGHRWTADRKRDFYLDVDNLHVLPAAENLDKSDHDPAEWTPRRNRCDYIAAWVETKQAYGLAADQAEADAIRAALADCPPP